MSLKTPILTTPSVYWAKAELVASSAATAIRLRVVFMLSLHAGPAALGILSGVMAGQQPVEDGRERPFVPAVQIQTLGPHPEEADGRYRDMIRTMETCIKRRDIRAAYLGCRPIPLGQSLRPHGHAP